MAEDASYHVNDLRGVVSVRRKTTVGAPVEIDLRPIEGSESTLAALSLYATGLFASDVDVDLQNL